MLGELRSSTVARALQYLPFPYRTDVHAPDGWELLSNEAIAGAPQVPLDVDAVTLTEEASPVMMDRLFERLADPLLPVVSLIGLSQRGVDTGDAPWKLARNIIERCEDLPQDIRTSGRIEDLLLARMYTRGADLVPKYSVSERSVITYPIAGRLEGVAEAANQLAAAGLLQSRFLDCLHTCPSCSSAALNVREECRKCRSADLYEQEIVHHFRCGHQAPLAKFESVLGNGLHCPKCNLKLRHIGLDYDKPGSVMTCRACAHTDDSNAVGFVCLHCEGKFDAAQVPTKRVYSFTLTPQGVRQLLSGRVEAANGDRSTFNVLLYNALQQQATLKVPFQIVRGQFVIDPKQPHQWVKGMRIAADALALAVRNCDSVAMEADGFHVLMPHVTPRQAKHYADDIKTALDTVVSVDLRPCCTVLSPTEVSELITLKLGR